MEHFRLLLAIVLSVLVFFVWEIFFVEKKMPQQSTENNKIFESAKENLRQTSLKDVKTRLTNKILMDNKKAVDSSMKPAKTVTVNTPLYNVQISEAGAVFKSFILKNYRETIEQNSPLLELIPSDLDGGTVQIGFAGNGIQGLENAVFSTELSSNSIELYDMPMEISFLWQSPEGIIIEKKYFFNPETYLIGLKIIITNNSTMTLDDNLIITLQDKAPDSGRSIGFEGPSALINNKLK